MIRNALYRDKDDFYLLRILLNEPRLVSLLNSSEWTKELGLRLGLQSFACFRDSLATTQLSEGDRNALIEATKTCLSKEEADSLEQAFSSQLSLEEKKKE